MFQETPIYNRLVAERGDIPVQVRGEAERIHRTLTPLLGPPPSSRPAWQPQGGAPVQGGRPPAAPPFPELP
ncbi:hypothetical protein [Streptomyces sp. NPDC047130]|uniref:hypothetical protein n=1 Tax=Streptomyces sp. NPDC047130 TaxID=3155261 RepID=UPI0033E582CC